MQVVRHALSVSGNQDVMLEAEAASDVPVGAEAYLLGPFPQDDKTLEATLTADLSPQQQQQRKDLSVGMLGKQAYGVLQARQALTPSKLLTGLWRDVALQLLPYLHPQAKGAGELAGRAALLVTGSQGTGKATEVYAAAAALGVGVYEIDGRQLAGGNPMDEASGINALIECLRSVRFAPAGCVGLVPALFVVGLLCKLDC